MKRKSGSITNQPELSAEPETGLEGNVILTGTILSRGQRLKANIWLWHRRLIFWGGSNK